MTPRLVTRTTLARRYGMSVAALKKHMVAVGILDPTGRSPTIAAHLRGIVEYRVRPENRGDRYFLLDREEVERDMAHLRPAGEGDRPHIHGRHRASSLLARAGATLHDAVVRSDLDDPACGTASTDWLRRESWTAIVPETVAERHEYARRLEEVVAGIRREIASGMMDGDHAGVGPALRDLADVAEWFHGRRRQDDRPVPSPDAVHPTPVLVQDAMKRLDVVHARLRPPVMSVDVPMTTDEMTLLRTGHTFTNTGRATWSATYALELAGGYWYPPIGTEATDIVAFRMSCDEDRLMSVMLRGDRAYYREWQTVMTADGVTLSLPDGESEDERRRLHLDFMSGSLPFENAIPVIAGDENLA